MKQDWNYLQIKDMYLKKGYKFYDSGAYNVNIGGIRNPSTEVDKFNDLIFVAYLDEFRNQQCLLFAATTKPGLTYLKDKLGSADGTAILIPGQYPKSLVLGLHNQGTPHEHKAFRQAGPGVFKVWRDKNSDGKLDYSGKIYDDVKGLNLHTTREFQVSRVGGFSAACQVVEDDKEHRILISVGERSAELYSNLFTYTLF